MIGVIGVWIRNHLEDTPQFEEMADKGETKKLPIKELLKTSGGSVVKIVMLGALIVGGYYIASVYAATYLQTEGGQTSSVAFLSTSLALVLGVITLPIAGYAADKYGRKPVLFIGSVASAVLGVPMFMLMSGGTIWQAVVGQSVLFICVSIVNGASFVVYVEMLKRRCGTAASPSATTSRTCASAARHRSSRPT